VAKSEKVDCTGLSNSIRGEKKVDGRRLIVGDYGKRLPDGLDLGAEVQTRGVRNGRRTNSDSRR